MDEQAIIRQISNLDEPEARVRLQRVHQMQDHLNAVRSEEIQARNEWLNSSELIFPENFTDRDEQAEF
jgi:hypothetical protein